MKKYVKPEVKVEDITLTTAIAALTVSQGKVATYENVDQGTWAEWGNLFE
jgi:hypothetical protein